MYEDIFFSDMQESTLNFNEFSTNNNNNNDNDNNTDNYYSNDNDNNNNNNNVKEFTSPAGIRTAKPENTSPAL